MRLSFFIFWQADLLALISYAAERGTCGNKRFSSWELGRMVGSAVGVFSSLGGYHLYPSGTYCFFNCDHGCGILQNLAVSGCC
jgi:hypothetical protein